MAVTDELREQRLARIEAEIRADLAAVDNTSGGYCNSLGGTRPETFRLARDVAPLLARVTQLEAERDELLARVNEMTDHGRFIKPQKAASRWDQVQFLVGVHDRADTAVARVTQLEAAIEKRERLLADWMNAGAERDAAVAALTRAKAWLADAEPHPERNGDHFRELREILAGGVADQPEPTEPTCEHDSHITTTSGTVMGQQNRDGSGWQVCTNKKVVSAAPHCRCEIIDALLAAPGAALRTGASLTCRVHGDRTHEAEAILRAREAEMSGPLGPVVDQPEPTKDNAGEGASAQPMAGKPAGGDVVAGVTANLQREPTEPPTCICEGAAYFTAEANRSRHPFIVNAQCVVHGPLGWRWRT